MIFTDNVKIIQFTTVTQCRLCSHGRQLENDENVLRIHIKNMDIRHLRKSCQRRFIGGSVYGVREIELM